MKMMFDTNVFDKILDGEFSPSLLSEENEYFVTHIQHDEIGAIPDAKVERREKLLEIFQEFGGESVSTESIVFGVSRFGGAKFGDGKLLEKIRSGNLRYTEDALIGETAIKNDMTLVTGDDRLRKKIIELGGKAITWEEFLENE